MVIGTPDVDHAIKTALVFVEVIGDVRGEIGIKPVFALDDAIFLVAEIGGAEPASTVLFVDVTGCVQFFQAASDHTRIEQRIFREPVLKMHAKTIEIVATIGQLLRQCMLMDIRPVFAEQGLAVGDQRIQMMLALRLGFVIGPICGG